ncbi:MAG: phosphotransferase [Bacteroidales bacterium]|nr:phosphotransferase [Bacteroidales bacterium]
MQSTGQIDIQTILTHYDLGDISSITSYDGGRRRAAKWKIESSRGLFLLKRRRAAQRRLARTRLAHALQHELQKVKYPLATLVPTKDEGQTLLIVGSYLYELFQWIDGGRGDGSGKAMATAGAQLAELHRVRSEFLEAEQVPVGGFHDSERVRQHLKKLDHQEIEGDQKQWRACIDALMLQYNRASIEVNQRGYDDWPLCINHGDWHPGNLLFQGDQIQAVLDFDAVQVAPAVADLANGLLQFSLVAGDPQPAHWPAQCDRRRLLHFWNGYCNTVQCSRAEIAVIPYLMIETLIAEAVLPIAATGIFDHPHGLDFLLMIRRKVQWLQEHAQTLVQALLSVQEDRQNTVKVAS